MPSSETEAKSAASCFALLAPPVSSSLASSFAFSEARVVSRATAPTGFCCTQLLLLPLHSYYADHAKNMERNCRLCMLPCMGEWPGSTDLHVV